MKILILPSWYPSKTKPNNGSFFKEQSEALAKDSLLDVTVINTACRSREAYWDKDNFRINHTKVNGVDLYERNLPNLGIARITPLCIAVSYLNTKSVFKKYIKKNGIPDVIHAHSYYPAGYVAVKLGRKYGIPVVVTEHSSSVLNKNYGKIRKKLLKTVLEKSDSFLCVSKGLLESIEQSTGIYNKCHVFPNLVNSMFAYGGRKDSNEKFTFISAGNLQKSKGFDKVISAFLQAFTLEDNVQLVIAGEGTERGNLEKIIKNSKRTSQIKLMGQLDRSKIANLLRKSDVFVLASEYETFGVVYIEAMASGLPVITQVNGGSNALINSDNGILLKDDSIQAYSSAMKEMMINIFSYDGRKISEDTIEKFGEKSYVHGLKTVYSKSISGKLHSL